MDKDIEIQIQNVYNMLALKILTDIKTRIIFREYE